jgi:hypothetical protein
MDSNLPGRSQVSRWFYLLAAVAMVLVVFAGFARTFYLRPLFVTGALSGIVRAHGFIMSLWFALFILQAWLAASGRLALHRRVGVAGAFWAAAMLAVGVAIAIAEARQGRPRGSALPFLVVPLGDISVFFVLVALGLLFRHRGEIHKRFMLLSSLALLPPAIGRIPHPFLPVGGPLFYYGMTDVGILICVVYDTAKHRRLSPAFLWGGLFAILSQPARLLLATTPVWIRFATWLVR